MQCNLLSQHFHLFEDSIDSENNLRDNVTIDIPDMERYWIVTAIKSCRFCRMVEATFSVFQESTGSNF